MDELLDRAPCGFLTFTDDGRVAEANRTLLDLLGYGRDELRLLHVEKLLSAPGRIFYQTHFFPLLRLRGEVEEVYLSLRAKEGGEVPVLVNAARRERGGVVFNDCVLVPMRQRDRYENEILRAKKEAEAATRAKDEFLSVVSHELRTPLHAILGWSQMLETGNPDAATVKRGVEAIKRSARTQTQLIEDILDYARIISGKLKMEVARVDPARVVEAAVEVVTPAAVAKDVRLQTVLDSGAPVAGDAGRLQQVMWNLLQNAVKFTPRGGRVQVRVGRAGSAVEISVADTGQGISPEFLPYVFDRFRQADDSKTRRAGGLGLGLAIVRQIVELHGGTIRVESPGEGLGTTFTVRLPVMIIHRKETDAGVAAEKVMSPVDETGGLVNAAPRLDGLRALVVDDEADAREILVAILSERGALVTAAGSVADAVRKFQAADFDLVISDIEMPGGGDGYDLIKKLKAHNRRRKRKIPAIALTAQARPSERLKILSAGYQTHLSKPVETSELLAVVANFADLTGRH